MISIANNPKVADATEGAYNYDIKFYNNKTQLNTTVFEYTEEEERRVPVNTTKFYINSDNKYKVLQAEESEQGKVWAEMDCDKDEGYEVYQKEAKRMLLLKDHLEKFQSEEYKVGKIAIYSHVLKEEYFDFIKELLDEENQIFDVRFTTSFAKQPYNINNAISMNFSMEYLKENYLYKINYHFMWAKIDYEFELPEIGNPY